VSANPERDVIDAIDELVNEQLAVGPVDDYNADRYIKCRCGHDWHGIQCVQCACLSSDPDGRGGGAIEAPRYTPRRDISFDIVLDEDLQLRWQRNEEHPWAQDPVFRRDPPWMRRSEDSPVRSGGSGGPHQRHACSFGPDGRCVWAGCDNRRPRRGYTLADLEAMARVDMRPYAYHQWGQRRTVRFWSYEYNTDQWILIEGGAEVLRIDWDRHGATVRVRLDPVQEMVINREDAGGLVPVAEHPAPRPDMIAMEGATADGFQHLGYLETDDLTIERNTEYGQAWGGGDRVRLQERYEVHLQIRDALSGLLQEIEQFNDRRHR